MEAYMKVLNQDKTIILDSYRTIQLVTRSELALILKMGISTIDQIPEKELPRVRLGKSVRFTQQSIRNYIQKHETPQKGVKNAQ